VQDGFEIREYRSGDEREILALFGRVFGRERSAAHWHWKFAASPALGAQISLAVEKHSGRIAGHYAVVPIRLNWMGRPVLAAQSVDTMVHPDAQGQGLFEATASHLYAVLGERGVRLVYGVPNANSYPGFVRKLGWKRLAYLRSYQRRLSIGAPIARAFGSRVLGALADLLFRGALRARLAFDRWLLRGRLGVSDVAYRYHERCPAAWQALWDRLRSGEVLSLYKDAEYFAWRYDRHPERRFGYATLERGGELVALAVVELDHRRELRVCELFAEQRNPLLARLLLCEIARRVHNPKAEVLSFRGLDAGFFDAAFAGFEVETDFSLIFAGRELDCPELENAFSRLQDWSVTLGDTDLV
jgi:GNAT superfamily N-acetyltransferase